MATKSKLNLKVLSEKEVVYYGDCDVLFVPYGKKQTAAIMAHHTPVIMKLTQGDVTIRNGRKKQHLASIDTGLLYVGENEASLLVGL